MNASREIEIDDDDAAEGGGDDDIDADDIADADSEGDADEGFMEVEVEGADGGNNDNIDGRKSGVGTDSWHVMHRVTKTIPSQHAALPSFSHFYSQALFEYNKLDYDECKVVAEELWPHLIFEKALRVKRKKLQQRIKRRQGDGGTTADRVGLVFDTYAKIVDPKTGKALFSRKTWKAAKAVLETSRAGWIEDPPGVALYAAIGTDNHGLTIYICFRGSGPNEKVHQKLVPVMRSLQNASPELASLFLLDFSHRHNMRADARNRGGKRYGHFDIDLLDELQVLEEAVYEQVGGVSMKVYRNSNSVETPGFVCGVTSVQESWFKKAGLLNSDQIAEIAPVLKLQSAQVRGGSLPSLEPWSQYCLSTPR